MTYQTFPSATPQFDQTLLHENASLYTDNSLNMDSPVYMSLPVRELPHDTDNSLKVATNNLDSQVERGVPISSSDENAVFHDQNVHQGSGLPSIAEID